MKTLVIHPEDESTDFLKEIYRDTDWTIILRRGSKRDKIESIKEHDRIIMMGHGVPEGLLDPNGMGGIITSNDVYLLRQKLCIGIWCNADRFFEKYKLHGIYTGMIISEYHEAQDNSITPTQSIGISNAKFATTMRDIIVDETPLSEAKIIHADLLNPIVQFNLERIYTSN